MLKNECRNGVTSGQILTLLKSRHSVFRVRPYPSPNGDWKFNLKGMAGKAIELTVALKNHHQDPTSVLVTVWIE